jgi:hypothetical protein
MIDIHVNFCEYEKHTYACMYCMGGACLTFNVLYTVLIITEMGHYNETSKSIAVSRNEILRITESSLKETQLENRQQMLYH